MGCCNICSIQTLLLLVGLVVVYHIYLAWQTRNKKTFDKKNPTNVLITGGVQGLGKLIASQFTSKIEYGAVNVIVIDIAENLAEEMFAFIRKESGNADFKNIHFYKGDLSNSDNVEELWAKIVKDHGPIHILINNAAICLGKRVSETSINLVKLVMNVNFISYVHLCMLFLRQPEVKSNTDQHKFHLVNVSSIAGHMTCQRNSDYSASKFALTGYLESLRQELEWEKSTVKMTTFYPYFINTGLFEGFNPRMRWILDVLDADYVARRMFHGVLGEEKEVYIKPIIYWLKVVVQFLPLDLKNWVSQTMVGEGMEYFQGRLQKKD